jgi:hypothetical protein
MTTTDKYETYYSNQLEKGLKNVRGWVPERDIQQVKRLMRDLREKYLDELENEKS